MSREQSLWSRNIEEAEEFEDAFNRALEDGVISARERTTLLLGARRNVQRHDENLHVVSLGCALLTGGDAARSNYHSQVNKRERLNRSAGYRTLAQAEEGVSRKQATA